MFLEWQFNFFLTCRGRQLQQGSVGSKGKKHLDLSQLGHKPNEQLLCC